MKVAVVTGTRAEFGLFKPLLKRMVADDFFELQLIVTGAHLAAEFGESVNEIEASGFPIAAKVDLQLDGGAKEDVAGALSVSRTLARSVSGLAEIYSRLKPDLVVLLGDRYETFGAATAAHLLNIPIAHLHGGETTAGSLDEAFRHSITKMAHLHFAATEEYRRRIIQLGEAPKRIFNVGALGLDNINDLELMTRAQLEASLNFRFRTHNFLVTYHPETLHRTPRGEQGGDAAKGGLLLVKAGIEALLEALNAFPEAGVILTYPGADAGGELIIAALKRFAESAGERVLLSPSLGVVRYLSSLKEVSVVVGNSSSGIIEAPAFKTPTVNIGERQRGRIRSATVIDVRSDAESIRVGIERALSPEFRDAARVAENPYGEAGAAERIIAIMKREAKSGFNLQKDFFDVEFSVCD